MGATFKDHFSAQAGRYSRYRPRYPEALFSWLASAAPSRDLAWDCATGSGQAAEGMVGRFDRVVATDASGRQVAEAHGRGSILYAVAAAESTPLASASVDLITVAQALHWFDLEGFAVEAERVLRPRGLLAAWTYGLHRIDPAVDTVVQYLYADIVGSHWPPERRLVEEGYADLHLPFDEINAPGFAMEAEWTLDHLIGYLRTWSAVRRYLAATGRDPVDGVVGDLRDAWGDPNKGRAVSWPLKVRVWRRDR